MDPRGHDPGFIWSLYDVDGMAKNMTSNIYMIYVWVMGWLKIWDVYVYDGYGF